MIHFTKTHLIIFLVWLQGIVVMASASSEILVARVDNQIINPTVTSYLSRAIKEAHETSATCLIIQLDTPGGLLESTHQIVRQILNATIPIVVYISPQGGRAGSAGVFITYASHIAAMAPSTRIGAAHPVNLMSPGGQPPEKTEDMESNDPPPSAEDETSTEKAKETTPAKDSASEKSQPENLLQKYLGKRGASSPMDDKILNDTLAWIEGIASERGRDIQFAIDSVKDSKSITEHIAKEKQVVEFIALDLKDLIEKIDGVQLNIAGKDMTLATKDKPVRYVDMRWIEKILDKISHPQVAYYLFLLGILGLVYEFTHPGFGFPGTAGGICLLLGLYSFQTLPINYVGLALILFGVVLSIVEFFTPTFGLLGLGGFISFIIGSFMLIDSDLPFLKIGLISIISMGVVLFSLSLLAVSLALKSMRKTPASGKEGMVGLTAEVVKDLSPSGKVSVHGEIWNATLSAGTAHAGERVKVTEVRGLHLKVETIH